MPKRPRAIDLWDDPVYSNIKDDDQGDNSQYDSDVFPSVGSSLVKSEAGGDTIGNDSETTSDSDSDENDDRDLNETCVTPLIALLSRRFFRDLRVVGPRNNTPDVESITKELLLESEEYNQFTDWLLEIVNGPASRITFNLNDLLKFRSVWYSKVTINSVSVQVSITLPFTLSSL